MVCFLKRSQEDQFPSESALPELILGKWPEQKRDGWALLCDTDDTGLAPMLYIPRHECVLYTPPNIWDILSLESPDSQTLEWGGLGTC